MGAAGIVMVIARRVLLWVAGWMAVAGPVATATIEGQQRRISPDDLRAEQVREAIRDGTRFLLGRRDRATGGWGEAEGFRGAASSLVTLALLNAGIPPGSDAMKQAMADVLQTPSGDERSTYVVSLRVMCIVAAGARDQRMRGVLEDDVKWLLSKQRTDRAAEAQGLEGGWSYGRPGVGAGDFSNSQFALLALHEASLAGVEVPREAWQRSYKFWQAIHNREGSFGYTVPPGESNGARTCAGISSLLIIREHLGKLSDYLNDRGEVACCLPEPREPMLDKAWSWLARAFRVNFNPTLRGVDGAQYYYLYGLERANRLSGRRFVGRADWYREGAAELVSTQQIDGSWVGNGQAEGNPLVATSMALLFLSKGLRPMLFGRYEMGEAAPNVEHEWGLHNLTRLIEGEWNQPLVWQSVNAATADVNDLRESPVLFLSARAPLQLSDAQKSALRQYVESGKFLFVEACRGDGCPDDGFDAWFRELMVELFPESRLEPLPPDHPVWTAQHPLQPDPGWPLLGLQACCRTSVIYCPRNLSGYWRLDRPGLMKEASPAIRGQVEYCRHIGMNVAAYATGRVLEQKLEVRKLGDSVVETLRGRALVFPKLHLGAGDDDAASAWRNLQTEVAGATSLNIDPEKRFVDPVLDQLSDHTLVFAHGRQRFSLSPDQREALRTWLDNGGFLFADAVCSSRDFAEAFRREFGQLWPEAPLEPIPAGHEIWTDSRFGYELKSVSLRRPDPRATDGFRIETTPPLLEGITRNGRLVVVFSPWDLSCALENTAVSHCEGYVRDDAIRIGTNVILYRMRAD